MVIRWPTLRTNSRLRPGSVKLAAVGRGVVAIRLQRAASASRRPCRSVAVEIAPHQAEPVGIGGDLVLGVDRGDRILEIDDRGQRGFEHDVGDARRIVAADRVARGRSRARCAGRCGAAAAIGAARARPAAPDRRARRAPPVDRSAQLPDAERHRLVEEGLGPGDHLRAARRDHSPPGGRRPAARRCRRARRRGCPSAHWRR